MTDALQPQPKRLNFDPGDRRLYRDVANMLEEQIRDGQYLPGAKLPTERDMATTLGVSRTTVREAFIALEIAGLIRIRMGSGVYVCAPDLTMAAAQAMPPALAEATSGPFELIDARLTIEPELAANAATRRSQADLAAMEAAIAQSVLEYRTNAAHESGDRDFHLAVARACGNAALSRLARDLLGQMETTLWGIFQNWIRQPAHRLTWIEDHRAVYAAIQAQDRRKARAAMRTHLGRVEQALKSAPISND